MVSQVSWALTGTFPVDRQYSTVVLHRFGDPTIYSLGGRRSSDGVAVNAIYRASVNTSTGALSAWATNTAPLPSSTFGHSGWIGSPAPFDSTTRVYALGGCAGSNLVLSTYAQGTIAATSPYALSSLSNTITITALQRGFLSVAERSSQVAYVTGGFTNSFASPTYQTTSAVISIGSGSVNPQLVANGTALPEGRAYHSSFFHGSYLYVVGGQGAAGSLLNVIRAPVTGSSIGSWSTFSTLPVPCFLRTVAVTTGSNPLVPRGVWYVSGNTLYYGAFNVDGSGNMTGINWSSAGTAPAGTQHLILYAGRWLYAVETAYTYVADLANVRHFRPALSFSGFDYV